MKLKEKISYSLGLIVKIIEKYNFLANKFWFVCYKYVHLRTVFFMVLNLGYGDWLS